MGCVRTLVRSEGDYRHVGPGSDDSEEVRASAGVGYDKCFEYNDT
jgi:hypothetical protein